MIKKLSSRIAYQNPWLTLREDGVEFANGNKSIFSVVDKPDFALIIPFDGTHFYLVTQYRYPTQQNSLEFPQGVHEQDPTIDPTILAKSELKEETGFTANKIIKIGFLHEAPGYSTQGFHIFLATELVAGDTQFDDNEDLELIKMTMAELETAITDGKITDTPTVAAYGILKLKNLL